MVEIDASGLLCPLPVLKARKALAAMVPGQMLRLLATDPAARIDLPHFCAQGGHALIDENVIGERNGAELRAYVIRCGEKRAIAPT
jgi:tRNA 2-thiouridine synthesizing protein A